MHWNVIEPSTRELLVIEQVGGVLIEVGMVEVSLMTPATNALLVGRGVVGEINAASRRLEWKSLDGQRQAVVLEPSDLANGVPIQPIQVEFGDRAPERWWFGAAASGRLREAIG